MSRVADLENPSSYCSSHAIEGYHFKLSGPHHKDLAALIDFDKYELNAHGKWWDFKGPPVPTKTAFGEIVEGQTYQTDWFYNNGEH